METHNLTKIKAIRTNIKHVHQLGSEKESKHRPGESDSILVKIFQFIMLLYIIALNFTYSNLNVKYFNKTKITFSQTVK